ncbi:MAG: cbb3-type cytochrome c oxidase subunit I [Planctomycetota bacterium]
MTTSTDVVESTEAPVAAALRSITLRWVATALVLFPVLVLLGLVMRVAQSDLVPDLDATRFYSVMTLHGVGMVGLWYTAGMASVCFLLSRYVRVSVLANKVGFASTLIGVALLLVSTLIGKFGAGWYFLYPLPIRPLGAWESWATVTFFAAIAVLGVGWTIWSLDVLRAIASRYSLTEALGWGYLRGNVQQEVPPMVLITTVSIIGALVGLVTAVVLLVLYAVEALGGDAANDALLMKNLVFLFGHLLVNITLYLGVAVVYEVLPHYAKRPWKTNGKVALAWNVVLVLVMFAYLHHLYMDFAQLRELQLLGQVTSYLSSVPAAIMSIFGTLALVYRSHLKWSLAPALLFSGVLGWVIGGIGAVIDSTIAVNLLFHNTLWVPAHFHTYFLMGVVLMLLGGVYHICDKASTCERKAGREKLVFWLTAIGGYGFLLMFYIGGAASIPRRYATYTGNISDGQGLALASVFFIVLFLAGLVIYAIETGRRCLGAAKAS